MGKVIATFSEKANRFFPLYTKVELTLQERRRLLGSPLRYCVGGNYIYYPAKHPDLDSVSQLCWARIYPDAAYALPAELFDPQPPDFNIFEFCASEDCSVGDRYLKRQKETPNGMVDVSQFCGQELFDAVSQNQEVLYDLKKDDFEALCAEIFARRGFKVDLFRSTKDDGIDFLAVEDGDGDPTVLAVQCKLPDSPPDGGRLRTTGVPVVREIFGVACAFGYSGAVAISASTFSREARQFANLQPDRIQLSDITTLQSWIHQYRWNPDEAP
ncbi:MAG: restriction endonuclease [Prosthecobacter sp.]|jgi:hypothetical protein|uniref:restriction endonuclease n=1 Tax=Prosthecobacter sp. TaxID=1965333 RepID=UPI0019FF3C11|nr:restriction endonuclease [Prosthecobacter sp.]MBE2285994.1 restriction endonuclease [Prosthecobacter sp.]